MLGSVKRKNALQILLSNNKRLIFDMEHAIVNRN